MIPAPLAGNHDDLPASTGRIYPNGVSIKDGLYSASYAKIMRIYYFSYVLLFAVLKQLYLKFSYEKKEIPSEKSLFVTYTILCDICQCL